MNKVIVIAPIILGGNKEKEVIAMIGINKGFMNISFFLKSSDIQKGWYINDII